MMRVATDKVSRNNRTSFFAQILNILLENANFFSTSFVEVLIFNELQAKSVGMEYGFQKNLHFTS